MKKMLIIVLLTLITSMAYAQSCPPIEQIFEHGQVKLPPGWEFKVNPNIVSNNIEFVVAMWGDHHSTYTPIGCYYYDRSNVRSFIYIQTLRRYDRSSLDSNSQWQRGSVNDPNYYVCYAYDVDSCLFN